MTFALVTKTAGPNTRCRSEDLGTRREKKRASGLHEDAGAATRSGFPARGGDQGARSGAGLTRKGLPRGPQCELRRATECCWMAVCPIAPEE